MNFVIFKHPGTKSGLSPSLPTSATLDPPPTPSTAGPESETGRARKGSTSRNDTTTVVEKLQSIGLKCVEWTGKCEADKVTMGRYDVPEGGDGMYGLVFDNTFSKQVSKTATFVLMTHPTSAPPKSGAQLAYRQNQAGGSHMNLARPSPDLKSAISMDSLPPDTLPITPNLKASKQHGLKVPGANFHTGILYKKRRKRNQGYARRFFSLDFASSTLSYYRNGHASALRGAIPLSLAAIGVNEQHREFSIDSGAEVWHLKVRTKKDFEAWRMALEQSANSNLATSSPGTPAIVLGGMSWNAPIDQEAEREWERVEELVARVSGSRDAVRRLAQDTDPKYGAANGAGTSERGSPSATSTELNPFFQEDERSSDRKPFWKRKPSSSSTGGSPSGLFRRSFSAQAQLSVSAPLTAPSLSPPLGSTQRPKSPIPQYGSSDNVHERCMALLRDLDATVSEFSALVAESKSRRLPSSPLPTSNSRMSLESVRSQDFFDAEEGQSPSQLLTIRDSIDMSDGKEEFLSDEEDSETSSDAGGSTGIPIFDGSDTAPETILFPAKPKIITPKDVAFIQGRSTVPPPKQPPPSIIGFLRKNAGKDLSTVSMPVSANEPTSLLQRLAEPLETAYLLSKAASASLSGSGKAAERLLYVAAFAVSTFSSNRVKERAIRKPFNPMLGETYELVRHETSSPKSPSYRFVAEKVSHHPVRMAWQADSLAGCWSLAQSPQPVQKFWGKSVELNTEGQWRLVLHSGDAAAAGGSGGERFTWSQPTCFLRNVLAGEKYVEPVQSMTIINESNGLKAVAVFKAAGMFSGRSEDVNITLSSLSNPGSVLEEGLIGKWTTGLSRTDTGEAIWEVGPLIADSAKCYGFTTFAAGLNEITSIEKDALPQTDSRLRPDQRALEEGMLDKAEAVKARLEERQRARRKILESHGREYVPRFFERVGAGGDGGHGNEEEVWKLKSGRDGYWECRERREWNGVEAVFEV